MVLSLKRLERSPRLALVLLTLGCAALFSFVALRRHAAFGSSAFDLGLFTNALWNLIQGHGYVSSPKGGLNLFADHASPIGWLFAPLLALTGSEKSLLIAQSIALSLGAWPLVGIAHQYRIREPRHTLALALVYEFYPALRAANAFDFHPEVLFLPLALSAIWLCHQPAWSRRWLGLLALALAMACKESSVATSVGIGLAWAFGAGPAITRDWTRRLGVALALSGTALFVWEVLYLPTYWGQAYAYSGGYPTSLGEAIQRLAQFSRLKFVLGLLAPLALLPLLGGAALWAAVPPLAMVLLSPGDHRVNLHYHYGIEPAVGLLWATLRALRVRGPGDHALPRIFPARARLGWVLAVCTVLFHGTSEVQRAWKFRPTAATQVLHERVLPCLNPLAAVATNDSLVPHWALRRWIHGLDSLVQSDGRPVDCVVLDSKLNLWPLEGGESALAKLRQQIRELNFRSVHQQDTLEVWQHPRSPHACWSGCNVTHPGSR